MADVAPELIDAIKKLFLQHMADDAELSKKLSSVMGGSKSYTDALDFSDRVGQALSSALKEGLVPGALPDDTLYYNIAKRMLDELGGNAYDLAAEAAEQVQTNINLASGSKLKAISAKTKDGRISDLVNTVSGQTLDSALPKLTKGASELPLGAASDTMEANAEFQGKSGLRPKIIRTAEAGCCEWCSGLAGEKSYPVKNHDMYRRHPNCRCNVEYDPGSGDRKTIHEHGDAAQKRAQEKEREERIEKYNAMTAEEQKKYDAQREARQRFVEKQSTSVEKSGKIKTKYSPSPQRNTQGIQVSHAKYARLTGTMNTQFPGLSPEDGSRIIYDAKFGYVVVADGYGGLKIIRRYKLE